MASGGSILAIPSPAGAPQPSARRLTRRSAVEPATVFLPQDPSLGPEEHFPLQTLLLRRGCGADAGASCSPFPRLVNRFDSREILLAADGSCVNNGCHADGDLEPSGGCSFRYSTARVAPGLLTRAATATLLDAGASARLVGTGTPDGGGGGVVSFRLERRGPGGAEAEHTSNRAKLRAAIAALQFRAWGREGWRRVVVLTDLAYVAEGATRLLLPAWAARGWRVKKGRARGGGGGRGGGGRIANRDLWEELQGAVDALRGEGCEVSFWLVRGRDVGGLGDYMSDAKEAARDAARQCPAVDTEEFTKLYGLLL